jgi:two-component system chemotaxis response regulator CheB
MPRQSPLNVLVIDDSAVVRQILSALLSVQGGMNVTAAADPYIALRKMEKERPDVIVLDLEMPRMDGLTFLRKIMREDPIPVVICSGHAAQGTDVALRTLEEGAVDVLARPRIGVKEFFHESAVQVIDAVRAAAQARLGPGRGSVGRPRLAAVEPARNADSVLPPLSASPSPGAQPVVAIGASTGGPEALRKILEQLPAEAPPVVIVQHMPEGFTAAFARRLDQTCRIEVKEAADGDAVVSGRALIAPGNRHLLLVRRGAGYAVQVREGALVSRHRPSVDVLFRSVAQAAGPAAVGCILTGMGNDGAAGLLEMKQAGATTYAQDEESCVVFGMPREAIEIGAVDAVLPLAKLPRALLETPRFSRRAGGNQR